MNYSGYSSSYPDYSEQLDANASAPSSAHSNSYAPVTGYPSQEQPPKQMFNYTAVQQQQHQQQQQQQQQAAFYGQSDYGCYPNTNPMSVNPYGGAPMPYYYCGGQAAVASGTAADEEARLDASETSDAGKVTRQRTPRKRQRLRKDPNEPQKPVSAYALFFRDTQAAIKGQNPNASFGEVSKIVAAMWESLDSEAKNSYKQRTELAKKDYLKQRAAYRATHLSGPCQVTDQVASVSYYPPADRYVDYVPQGMLPSSQATGSGTFGGFFADHSGPSGGV